MALKPLPLLFPNRTLLSWLLGKTEVRELLCLCPGGAGKHCRLCPIPFPPLHPPYNCVCVCVFLRDACTQLEITNVSFHECVLIVFTSCSCGIPGRW